VTSLEISYFDGADWQTQWDGTKKDSVIGDLPVGPPCAIRITIKIRRPRSSANQDPREVEYSHVVAIPTANSFGQNGP
jgi:hypothetical protein